MLYHELTLIFILDCRQGGTDLLKIKYMFNVFTEFFKYFSKKIKLKGDVNYCINHKVPIFYE
jgi:hypothetical protein